MNSYIVFFAVVAVASAQMTGMGGMNMNFNLSTPQGILGFLNMEGINPNQLITQNCIANGNSCTPGGQPCCLNPVFDCLNNAGSNQCLVVPGHVNHLAEIRQIVHTAGVTTQNPIL
ncbi:uncharacterized protein [Halyomorpha halys]|uniref:uncharacterized protein n=1 Tax=Halyomorpha halys TaxID=286706 RepID=UPI0006D4F2FA|nr:uncharacterized protein LOC106691262 [Halyomorpha halys]